MNLSLTESMPTIGPIEDVVAIPGGVTLVTTAETVVGTLTGITTMADAQRIALFATCPLQSGAATTTVTPRFRRGSLTGTVIQAGSAISIPTAAGGIDEYSLFAVWTPGEIANETVVFTLTQAAATGNGSTGPGAMIALIGH